MNGATLGQDGFEAMPQQRATPAIDAGAAHPARGPAETAPAPRERSAFLMDLPISTSTGWGVVGLNLALHSVRRGDYLPIPLLVPDPRKLSPVHADVLAEAIAAAQLHRTFLERVGGRQTKLNLPFLRVLGNGVWGNSSALSLVGRHNIGLIVFEDTAFDAAALQRCAEYDRLVVASTWNADVLRAQGRTEVELCIQGIDPTIFHPAPRARWWADRFVVFSGGKLEFRKGQDLVVAAFREFHRRHPDALLMVAWHNYWPKTMAEIELRGHVRGVPQRQDDGRLDLVPWLEHNGIPRSTVLDLGIVPHADAGRVVREADVALFPNRAEGGTNLVAMECMASGVPAILSANTGHLDLIEDDNCFVLREQGRVAPTAQFRGTDEWGESSVEEVVEALEVVYRDRTEAERRGLRGSATLQRRTWQRQIDVLFDAVGDLL